MQRTILLFGAVFLSLGTILLAANGAKKNPGKTGRTPPAHVSPPGPRVIRLPPSCFWP